MKFERSINNDIRVIQITDTHIFADNQSSFSEIVSEDALLSVLELAKSSKCWPPDLILATGDLAQEPTAKTYNKIHDIMNALNVPVYCIPGNHDAPDKMDEFLNTDNLSMEKEIIIDSWCLLLLNSFKANTHSGELPQSELAWLAGKLEQHTDKAILIALHHHPVSIHSPWMDSMMLENGDEFLALIQKHSQVKIILWGHIHQEFHELQNEIEFIGSPSTCAQFKPGAMEYTSDDLTPGFRLLELSANGSVNTSVFRIANMV